MTNYITNLISESVERREWVLDVNKTYYLQFEINFYAETTFSDTNPDFFTIVMKRIGEKTFDYELIVVKEQGATQYSRIDYDAEQAIFKKYRLELLMGNLDLGDIPPKPKI